MSISQEHANHFSADLSAKILALKGKFETVRSAILPVLHEIQQAQGWIADADVLALERDFGLSAVDVREVLTFYTMYRQQAPKPFRFEICNSISCWLNGSESTLKALEERMTEWKKTRGEEPPFEVHRVACLGVCGHAPVAFVNDTRHLKVTPELALQLVDEYCGNCQPGGKR